MMHWQQLILASDIQLTTIHFQTYVADTVILCTGRFSGVPNIPTFLPNKGLENFDGTVIHSIDYSDMGAAKSTELIRGELVTVVSYQKSAVDIAAECASTNGEISSFPTTLHCGVIKRKKSSEKIS